MGENYYLDSESYPYVARSILERILIYYKDVLYSQDDITTAMKRFILADTGDDSASIRRSIDIFKNNQGEFPFTAYNITDDEVLEKFSHVQKSGNYYSEEFDCYIAYMPIKFTVAFTTYLNSPYDYWRVNTLLNFESMSLTRLDVPVTINDKLTSFSVTVNPFPSEKGSLAWDIEQYFGVGRIYPIGHNIEVEGAYIIANTGYDSSTGTFTGVKIVYHVDDIILKLHELQDLKNLSNNPLISTHTMPDIPKVISSIPTNEAEDILVDSSIVITFNQSMNEGSVISNLDIVPYFDSTMTFDNQSKILTITPKENLLYSTTYSILINTNAISFYNGNLEEDFELTFTTEDE